MKACKSEIVIMSDEVISVMAHMVMCKFYCYDVADKDQ